MPQIDARARRTGRGPATAVGTWLFAVLSVVAGTPLVARNGLAVAAPDASDPPPAPRLGGDLRIRGESFDNLLDLDDRADDSYQFTRMRYRLWVEAKPREETTLFFRLGGEYRWGQQSITSQGTASPSSIRDSESRVSLDNAWVDVAWPPRSGLSFRLGRQDLAYGEGFLVFDGTPADGSSSGYFDALKSTWARGPWAIDLFAAKLLDEGFGTPGRDEDLYGLYGRRTYEQSLSLETYLLQRAQRGGRLVQAGKPWAIAQPYQRTTAVGLRMARLPATGGFFAGEFAFQGGEYRDPIPSTCPTGPPIAVAAASSGSSGGSADDRQAVGGYLRAGWVRDCPYHGAIELGGLFLSGDNPSTARYEGWDPFYSEWPKYSELLIYTLYDATSRVLLDRTRAVAVPAGGAADSSIARIGPGDAGAWSNVTAAWIELRAEPHARLKVAARGMLLGADRAARAGGSTDRGKLVALRADLAGPAGLAMQALGEHFWPGDYYDLPANARAESAGGSCGLFAAPRDADPAWYARLQVTASF